MNSQEGGGVGAGLRLVGPLETPAQGDPRPLTPSQFHGKPCPACGGTRRYKTSRDCVACRARIKRQRRDEQVTARRPTHVVCFACATLFKASRLGRVPFYCAACGTSDVLRGRPKRPRHTLSAVDPIAGTAVCALCGPVDVYNVGTGQRCGKQRRAYKNGYTYGISDAERAAMLEAQGGRCPICLRDDPGPLGWHLDHDHAFDAKDPRSHRGILCQPCNTGLGRFGDSVEGLMRAVEYLKSHHLRLAA
jgi:hypothetical protein